MSAYGYSVYDSGFYFQGKVYPSTAQNYYGLSLFTPLNVNPFTAVPRDYATIMLQWTQPQGEIIDFRLLSNRYGYPVDENDGNILIDSSTFPGTSYADQDVIPGTYHYYGIYLLTEGVWDRAGFASCLMPFYYAEGTRMYGLLPTYFREVSDVELTQDATDNQYIEQFFNVIGWSADYLKTQYDMLARHLNDPMAIPLDDLMNLAAELGMPFQPEVPASLMRKSLANWTHVCQERGTPGGIAENITLLTGYPIDLRSGRNLMLENDQSLPASPLPGAWTAGTGYVPGENVTYGNYLYTCLTPGGQGTPPTGSTLANTYWQVVQNTADPAGTLANPNTVGGVNTWEAIYPALDAGGSYATPAGSLTGTIGLPDPLNTPSWTHSAFSVTNKSGSTQDMMLRCVSRLPSDLTGTNANSAPDPAQAVKDGIPIQQLSYAANGWLPSVRYATDSIVIYNNFLYQAQRASTNALPPVPGQPLNANWTFATNISPCTGGDGATIAQSSAQAFTGTYSMSVTPNGSTAAPGAYSEQVPVIPGATYYAEGWAYVTAGYNGAQTGMHWFDMFGQYISSSVSGVTSVPAATWTQVTETATAPGNAATGQLWVQLSGTPAGSVVSYWSDVSVSCWQTPEWCLISPDNRLWFILSGYTAQSLTTSGNHTVEVIPYVEWYDGGGNLITSSQARVVPRVTTPGTPGIPPNLCHDSFCLRPWRYLNGRWTDTRDQQWVTQAGLWLTAPFYGGCTYPNTQGTRCFATLTGLPGTTGAPVYIGCTFATAPESGQDCGIVFRAASASSYWRAGLSGLYSVTGGASTLAGTYSTACQPGDRLWVYLAGNVITVYRNGKQVLTVTNSFNATATLHGIACEAIGV